MKNINRGNLESNLFFLEKTGLFDFNKKVLEISSGKGLMLKTLRDRGYNVIGTEVNDEYIEFAKREFQLNLVKMKDGKIDFPDNYFDIVLSFDVFEHIPDSDFHLQEIQRVLTPNGFYLLSTPNKLTNIPFEIIKEKSFTKWRKYHCSLHTYWKLKKRFLNNNFEVEFLNIPLINDYFKNKIKKYLGFFGLFLIKIINPDYLPKPLKTNFYIIARKK